jgi:hypothetical protein
MSAGKPALIQRDIFTIARHLDGWAVEHNGEFTDPSSSKDEVRAAAHKHARASHDAGRPAQVTVGDETGFFHLTEGGLK